MDIYIIYYYLHNILFSNKIAKHFNEKSGIKYKNIKVF